MFEKILYLYYYIVLTPGLLLEEYEDFFLQYAIKKMKKKKVVAVIAPSKQKHNRDYAYEKKQTIINTIKKQPHALVLGYTPKDFVYIHVTRS